MFVRKFEGDTLDGALQAVKRELGPDAIILKTVTNKGLKGAFKKKRIEITAAISEQNYEKKARVDHVLDDEQKEEFYNAPSGRINHMINDYDEHREGSSKLGYGNIGLNRVVKSVSEASSKIKSSLDDFLAIEDHHEEDELADEVPPQSYPSESRVSSFSSTDESIQTRTEDDEKAQYLIRANQEYNEEISSELRQEITSQKYQIELLEQKLFELSEKISDSKAEVKEPLGVKGLRSTLRSLELNEVLIQKILKKASFELTKEDLEDVDLIYDFALREMNELIRVEMPLFSSADIQENPVVTALISENSCGQSSMAMKLAVLQENVRIIRFRENNLDQGNSDFTERVFNLDVVTVDALPLLMSEARKATEEGMSIILDLKLNFKEANEAKKFIEILKRSFEQVEFLVTVSAIHTELYNRKILSKFKSYADGVTLSYLDQCLSFGPLLNVHVEHGELPLKFFGTGPTVPDDIEAATAERILAGMFKF